MSTYLKKATLRGFRTIIDVQVDFKPGLNVIIGKNGSGKTNFMSFIHQCIGLNFFSLPNFFSELKFEGDANYTISSARDLNNIKAEDVLSNSLLTDNLDLKFKDDLTDEIVEFTELKDIKEHVKNYKTFNNVQFVRHGVNSNSFNHAISIPLSFDIEVKDDVKSDELFSLYGNALDSSFCRALTMHLLIEVILQKYEDKQNREQTITNNVLKVFSLFCETINREISKYLPIEAVRLNPAYKIYKDEEKQLLKFQGMILDFNFNGNWLPFSSLSDGTKRLFYLFAEICISPGYSTQRNVIPSSNGIILVEEPELGIHPHQFHLIMDFLKEVSTRNQVIITTHSPQALDIISEVELDAISICSFNSEEGTTIKKLSVNQIQKAKKYMEEMYLSDYWVHSNLENRN